MKKNISTSVATVVPTTAKPSSETGLTKEHKMEFYLSAFKGKKADEIVNEWTSTGYGGKTFTKYEHTEKFAYREATSCSIIPLEDRWIVCYADNEKKFVLNLVFNTAIRTNKYLIEISELKTEIKGDYTNYSVVVTRTPNGKTAYYKTVFTYGVSNTK